MPTPYPLTPYLGTVNPPRLRQSLSRTVAPTVQPILWADAKAHLRVDTDDEQGYVEGILIPAAVEWVEAATERQLITATYALELDKFPERFFVHEYAYGQTEPIRLPKSPLLAVSSITYLDSVGVQQTLDPTLYAVHAPVGPRPLPGYIVAAVNQTYPSTLQNAGAVTITFTAGYGADGSKVPAMLRLAILELMAEMFERRSASVVDVPASTMRLISPYTVPEAA